MNATAVLYRSPEYTTEMDYTSHSLANKLRLQIQDSESVL